MYFNKTYYSYSLPGQHYPDDIYKVMHPKVKVTDNIFQNTLFQWRHTDDGYAFPVEAY